MEYRKLISFGKSSYVVSIPKGWVIQNKLKKGDLIYFEESGPNLVLASEKNPESNKEKVAVINVDGKSIKLIDREVSSAYIQNCRMITLKGKEIRSKVNELQAIIQNLIALEIMEQTSETIIAKDFLNMDTVSVQELIRKMDIVTRTMLTETINMFNEDNSKGIAERDRDVDRLYFLLYRSILFNLENPTNALKKFKLKAIQLLMYNTCGFYIEGIADEARRISRYINQLKISRADKDEIEKLLNRINKFYLETMKSIYNGELDLALALSNQKKEIMDLLTEVEARNIVVDNFVKAISRMRILTSHIHNLGRVVYTISNY